MRAPFVPSCGDAAGPRMGTLRLKSVGQSGVLLLQQVAFYVVFPTGLIKTRSAFVKDCMEDCIHRSTSCRSLS